MENAKKKKAWSSNPSKKCHESSQHSKPSGALKVCQEDSWLPGNLLFHQQWGYTSPPKPWALGFLGSCHGTLPFFFCFYWYIIQLSDATVELPPNHSLFDVNSTKLSPVLQCWCDAQNQAAAPAAALTFNFTIIKEVIDILHGNQGVNAKGPAPLYQHALPVAIPVPPAAVPILPVANPQYDVQYPNILQADIL